VGEVSAWVEGVGEESEEDVAHIVSMLLKEVDMRRGSGEVDADGVVEEWCKPVRWLWDVGCGEGERRTIGELVLLSAGDSVGGFCHYGRQTRR